MIKTEIQNIKLRFGIIGNAEGLNRAIDIAMQVAPTDLSVLITGESGVGKESFPQIIHQFSRRKHGKYIAVNCGAIPEGTIDSELFGHEKGAFTGAGKTKKGLMELAIGGTVFLDEVGELPLFMQAKLLTFLEDRSFKRVGGLRDIEVNVRVAAATNRNLEEEVRKGTFREDLYYRLNVMQIHIPPLRERKEDIPVLCQYYLEHFNRKFSKSLKGVDPEFMSQLQNHEWKGNVRELRNVMERTALFARGEYLTSEATGQVFQSSGKSQKICGLFYPVKDLTEGPVDLKREVEAFERSYIDRAMDLSGGNLSRAAQLLGCTRFTLKRRLEDGVPE